MNSKERKLNINKRKINILKTKTFKDPDEIASRASKVREKSPMNTIASTTLFAKITIKAKKIFYI